MDFVVCQICNFHAQNLGIHLKKVHKLSSENYAVQYNGKTISEKSHVRYGENHFSYLTYAKENNVDLTEYWDKVSKGVSAAIMNNDDERVRRSVMMTDRNHIQQSDPVFQKIVSDTAKDTSSRPEILEARSEQLRKWREEYPEDFYEKCVKKMITTFRSKPERKLFEFVKELDGFNFKVNQFINSVFVTNKSHNKQMDMGDKTNRIYIEFDGILHFLPKRGDDLLKQIRQKDGEIERHMIIHEWTLIRVSYDQYIDKNKIEKSYFLPECLGQIKQILSNNVPGIYKIGKAYGKH